MGEEVPCAAQGGYDREGEAVICFLGDSHAAETLRAAAIANGLVITNEHDARLVFIAQDTPTNEAGVRNLAFIDTFVKTAWTGVPIILTSQVPPGFTRKLGEHTKNVFHMAETLRMKDAMSRAIRPEQFIIGVPDPKEYTLPTEFMTYMYAHKPHAVHIMSYEEAEFAKIAINMFLAAQVDTTNRLAAAAAKVGANWGAVANALRSDSRIGPKAYLEPGRWQESRHLLRDHVTLEEILAR